MPQRFKVTRSKLRKPRFYSSSPATMTVRMPASLACKWSIGHSDTRGAMLPQRLSRNGTAASAMPGSGTSTQLAYLTIFNAYSGVVSRNRRNFRHPSSSPVRRVSRSIILTPLWKV